MTTTARALHLVESSHARTWQAVQLGGLVATVVLLVGLVRQPTITLAILWSVVIPLVPVSLLIAPRLWRNVCPLATLNMLSNRFARDRAPSQRTTLVATVIGIVLLIVMVPARRFIFNTDGMLLAVTVAVVGVLALALGAVWSAKAGFCNAICPVLPVERLYGQRPLIELTNVRCASCNHCSVKGCIDLAPSKSIAPFIGGRRTDRGWLFTGYGMFAAAFPGFVLGYYQTVNGAIASAPAVYLTVLAWMAASYLTTTVIVHALRLNASQTLPALAAAAGLIYYWFASPLLAGTLGAPAIGIILRVMFLGIVLAWYALALGRSPRQAAQTT